jgi:hypothetical protein
MRNRRPSFVALCFLFFVAAAKAGAASPVTCSAGQCTPGQFRSDPQTCVVCPAGTYSNACDATVCDPCPSALYPFSFYCDPIVIAPVGTQGNLTTVDDGGCKTTNLPLIGACVDFFTTPAGISVAVAVGAAAIALGGWKYIVKLYDIIRTVSGPPKHGT